MSFHLVSLYKSQWYTEWSQIDKNDTISSHVKISVISLMSTLSLKLYLNSLVYHRNIFGSSSEVFGNFRKFSENVRKRSSGLQNNFSQIFGNLWKVVGNVANHQKRRVYTTKRTLDVGSKI